jgi:TolB protein
MRLTPFIPAFASISALTIVTAALGAPPAPPPAGGSPAKSDDLLGNLVVTAGAVRKLPKIGVVPSTSFEPADVTLRGVVRRDLDLCGEVEVLPEEAAPEGFYLPNAPVDVSAWAKKGAEVVIRVSSRKTAPTEVEIRGEAYFVGRGDSPVFDRRLLARASDVRIESHRMADLLIGALTGQAGGFASRLTFASGSGKLRSIYTMDADGHGAEAISPPSSLAFASAFGKGDEVYYSASANYGEYAIHTASGDLVPLPVKGSVYGIAASRDGSRVAVSIGVGSTLKLFTGPDFASIRPAHEGIGMVLHPTFTPSGRLAFAGEGRYGQRIYVDGKPISPETLFASSPTFCNHPDGVRAIFAVRSGRGTDLVATGELGGSLVRLTQSQGSNGSPACSPDGRLVAFFSTRTTGEGPGLYLMRVDGTRPKRISTLLGDSLRWGARSPRTAPAATGEAQAPTARSTLHTSESAAP